MWIHTKDGFFSVTTNQRDETGQTLMVRARVRGDLDKLLERVLAIKPPFFHQGMLPKIIETKTSDYRYRVILARTVWAEYLVEMTDDLDYTNVKGTLARGDKPRANAMMACWSAMADLQPGGPFGQDLSGYSVSYGGYDVPLELDDEWDLWRSDDPGYFPYDLLRP